MREWVIKEKQPGYFGKNRDGIHQKLDEKYGAGNWMIAYLWMDEVVPRSFAIQLYEDAYYEFLKSNPKLLDWLVETAKDVYDNSETNVNSGLDYNVQETSSNHLQDISVRRVVKRLGRKFEGHKLVQIRSSDSEGYLLSPGVVPFHLPEYIVQPHLDGWWNKDSIEDFYQSNKIILVKE